MSRFVLALYIELKDGTGFVRVLHRGTEQECLEITRNPPDLKLQGPHPFKAAKMGIFTEEQWQIALQEMELEPLMPEATLEA